MCIALPMRIVAVADRAAGMVVVEPGEVLDPSRPGRETVSAALVLDEAAGVDALVGGWGLTHAGHLVALVGEEDARSRLSLFAAMNGGDGLLDLGDFRAARDGREEETCTVFSPGPDESLRR